MPELLESFGNGSKWGWELGAATSPRVPKRPWVLEGEPWVLEGGDQGGPATSQLLCCRGRGPWAGGGGPQHQREDPKS